VPVAFHVNYWDNLGWPDPQTVKLKLAPEALAMLTNRIDLRRICNRRWPSVEALFGKVSESLADYWKDASALLRLVATR